MSKISNIIVIGGPIAAGKTSIASRLPFDSIEELDPNDDFQKILLKKMYEGDEIASQVFQLDMLLTRFDKYKKYSSIKNKTFIFDRMIFEDSLFAFMLFGDKKNVWNYYYSIWKDKINEIINDIGIPKFYIYLDVSWENFQKRIFKRNRIEEIENFESNKKYFKELLKKYDSFVIEKLQKYKIPYKIINTNNKNKEEVIEQVKKILTKQNLL